MEFKQKMQGRYRVNDISIFSVSACVLIPLPLSENDKRPKGRKGRTTMLAKCPFRRLRPFALCDLKLILCVNPAEIHVFASNSFNY